MEYTPGLWLFILASLAILGLFLYSWQFRKTETGRAFLFLMACAWVWVANFTAETAIQSFEGKMFFAYIEFIAIALLPVSWVYLVLAYTGKVWKKRYRLLLWVIPILTNLVIWTNSFHHWFMGAPRITQLSSPFQVLYMDYKFWFYFIHAPTGYLYVLIALVILMRSMIKTGGVYRAQGRLLLLAIVLPSLTDVLYVAGFSPVKYYNYTTAVFSLSGIILVWALFRFRFLDLLPLARDVVMDHLNDGMIVFDHKKRIIYTNLMIRKTFHISETVLGEPLAVENELASKIAPLFQETYAQVDMETNDPPDHFFDLQVTPVRNQQNLHIGWVATLREITERVQLFKQVQALSFQDGLTGIYNRRHFIDLCKREISRIQRSPNLIACVVMMDLDYFKIINDTYGHAAGDAVLISFTQAAQELLREYDIFGRLGGDEFALFLIDVNLMEAFVIVERLRASIKALEVSYGGQKITFNASFGIVSTRQLVQEDLKIEEMLEVADRVLYRAKQTGRNCVMAFEDQA